LKIPALIMAGGLGKRMGNLPDEKPLLSFLGKPLVSWVVKAVAEAELVSEFYIVTSPNTPKTEEYCRATGWKTVRTDANGYHEDLKKAVSELGWGGAVLTLPTDLPAITASVLDKIICQFSACKKDFLAVFVPIKLREELGLSISSTDEFEGVWYSVSGVNIVNGSKIQGEGKIETASVISKDIELLLNINTAKDLEIARKIMLKRQP
jgi:uncharacterized protein (TIGR00454 family)